MNSKVKLKHIRDYKKNCRELANEMRVLFLVVVPLTYVAVYVLIYVVGDLIF